MATPALTKGEHLNDSEKVRLFSLLLQRCTNLFRDIKRRGNELPKWVKTDANSLRMAIERHPDIWEEAV